MSKIEKKYLCIPFSNNKINVVRSDNKYVQLTHSIVFLFIFVIIYLWILNSNSNINTSIIIKLLENVRELIIFKFLVRIKFKGVLEKNLVLVI